MIDDLQYAPNREYVDAAVGTTNQPAPVDQQADPPWFRQYLAEMRKRVLGQGSGDGQNQAGMPTAQDKLSPYRKIGGGLHNLMAFADGGAVQGPTLAVIGEGGEREDVVPESKALPYAAHTMLTGRPPNPANLPRTPKAVSMETVTVSKGGDPSTEGELPVEAEEIIEGAPQETEAPATEAAENDPVLAAIKELTAKVDALAASKEHPVMACGGEVMPKFADGGMVLPQYGPPKPMPSPFMPPPNPANPYVQPDLIMDAPPDLPVNSAAPAFPGGMPQLQRPTRPLPPRMTGAADKYAALLKAAPKSNWFESMMAQPNETRYGTGPVASYGALGAGIRNTIGAMLPGNRKQAQYGRELEAAKAEVGAEKQANADAREETQLQAQMELNRARLGTEEKQGALYDKQAAKLDQPEKVKKSDLQEKLELFDASFPGADPAVRQQLFGIKPEKPEGDIETNDHKNYTLAMKDWPTEKKKPGFDEWLTSDTNRKAPRTTINNNMSPDKILSVEDAEKLGVPFGTTVSQATAKNINPRDTKPLSGEASKVYSVASTLVDDIESLKTAFRKDYTGAQAGILTGTNVSLADLASNIDDKIGRLRSGGAINKEEEARFRAQVASLRKMAFGSPEEGIQSLDRFASEARSVANGIKPGSKTDNTGQPTQHKTGDKVTLGGKEVTIKKINADGTFEY